MKTLLSNNIFLLLIDFIRMGLDMYGISDMIVKKVPGFFHSTKKDNHLHVSEKAEQWKRNKMEKGSLYYVDWEHNKAFYISPKSIKEHTGMSYHGCKQFREKFKKISDFPFMLQCWGYYDATICTEYRNELVSSWKKWNDMYCPDIQLTEIKQFESLYKSIETEKNFYEAYWYYQIYKVFDQGSKSGYVFFQ